MYLFNLNFRKMQIKQENNEFHAFLRSGPFNHGPQNDIMTLNFI